MADTTAGPAIGPDDARVNAIQAEYMAMAQRRRLYSFIMLIVFVALMSAGFHTADARNAGGFFDGFHRILDYPREVLGEAVRNAAALPGYMVRYFPSLIETLNIAAASTLIGLLGGTVLSLLSTRGLSPWPALIPVFRRIMDLCRAIPEIVIALVLIFVMGGGPVPAMIAIAIHTSGALGKLFSEVNENVSLKPVEGLASVLAARCFGSSRSPARKAPLRISALIAW